MKTDTLPKAICAAVAAALCGCAVPPAANNGAAASATLYPNQPGCKRIASTTNTQNTVAGAAILGTLGAAIGSQTHAPQGARNGAIIGALAGGLAGSQFNTTLGLTELSDGSVKMNIPGGVLFRSGSADINPSFQQTLNQFASVLRDYCGLTASVVGHTDNVGSHADNQRLSERRAEAVVAYLRQQSIDASRLSAEGKSSTVPVADNATEAGRSQNRRVEITVRAPTS